MTKKRIIIMGAAGRDFHNFNTVYRDRDEYDVVAFTATQIPDIEGRKYPSPLAGRLYPNGIPIHAESELTKLIRDLKADEVVFSYSDVPHEYVMHKASEVLAAGANFILLGAKATMLKARLPVIAVCAVRTGAGKSQTTRRVSDILKAAGKKIAVIRHPMPYGDLTAQRVQRFASVEDLAKQHCTIEEMEEYEPHLQRGSIVYAGVDYEAILRRAEEEAQIILWDGGNNDMPFYKPDLMITVADPLRLGHETTYHPGETNLLLADAVVINKVDSADPESVAELRATIRERNPKAVIIEAASPVTVENPSIITGKRVLVIEDGPTLTHGEMSYGAGVVAAEKFGAEELVDPRRFAIGSIAEVYEKYPNTGALLPAMGYGAKQIRELEATIAAADCDSVVIGTPIDLRRVLKIDKPSVRVTYELQEIGRPNLSDVLERFLK
ncbi:MAG TPA: cyclic 2,3-diphosphoglycerate synthase [bacterium]|jgi:predicted GTPase